MIYYNIITKQTSSKPTSAHTSNIWLSPEALKSEGWLPIDDKRPVLTSYESLGMASYEELATKVNKTYEIVTTSLDDYKAEAIKRLLSNAKNTIYNRLDAVEQLPSVYKILPVARRAAIDAEAVAVMGEFDTKKELINNAVDYAAVDLIYPGIIAFTPVEDIDANGWIVSERML